MMISTAILVLTIYGQAQTSPRPAEDASRAAAAAEKAAAAAQSAAESAAKAAEAAARVAAQVSPAAPGAPTAVAPAPAAPSKWNGSVGLGLISITGNAQALTFNGTALVERKGEEWIYGLKATGVYGTSRPPSNDPNATSQVLALAASLQLRLDRRLGPTFTTYVLGGAETDHVKSVEFRGFGEAGGAIIWVDTKEGALNRTFLRTDLAFRYANESRFQYYPTPLSLPGATLYAPRFGLAFRHSLSKEVGFLQDAEILPNVVGDGRVLVNTLSKLSTRLYQSLSLGVGFTVNYDSSPAPQKKTTDTALSVSLEYLL
jgi:putative salt-induced outer membrane protein YdiY